MSFNWRDCDGRDHRLDSCAPIEAEYAEIGRQLATHVADLESSDEARWEAALAATEPLVLRRNALLADLERWNDHAVAADKRAAAQAVTIIDKLVAGAALIQRLHAHFADHASTLAAGAAALDGQAATARTLALISDMAARHGIPVPPIATAADAHAWLCARPQTNRTPLPSACRAFAWRDRHDHTVQIRSLVEIEREQLALIGELAALRPKLETPLDAQERALALEEARIRQLRLIILEQDLERWVSHVADIRRQGARDRAKEISRFK